MHGAFEVWDANDPREREAWIEVWQQWPDREVSAHPDYGKLFAGEHDKVLCASYVTPGHHGTVLYPFIWRELSRLPIGQGVEAAMSDIITPYGYGGPYGWELSDVDTVSVDFWTRFNIWARNHNVVAEFIRFDLFPESLLPYPGDKVRRASNLVRSLELDDDAMWMSFEQKVRKNVKKAQRSGVTVQIDAQGRFISDFMRLYEGTMERREADSGYYFPRTFFESIHRDLAGQFAYFHALREDEIISTELVLISARSVYSFLGGTDSSAFDCRPNDLLKHEIIRWARAHGKKSFVLGGGAIPEDGIERYKRSFAPNGSVDFMTGQRILLPDLYQQLVEARQSEFALKNRAWPEESTFFPAYRMPL